MTAGREAPVRVGRARITKLALAGVSLAFAAGCASSGQPKTSVAYRVTDPTPSPAVSLPPLTRYRQAETAEGVLYIGVHDADIETAVEGTCYNTLDQMKKYVHTVRLSNKTNPGIYRDTLLDHALLISAYCPGERLEYDRAVRDEAPNVVVLPAN